MADVILLAVGAGRRSQEVIKNMNNLGTIKHECMFPAKLIIDDIEINVMVKSVEEHIDEEQNNFFEPADCDGVKKFACSKKRKTTVYTCEECDTEYGNFL